MKKLLLIICVFSLVFFSCGDGGGGERLPGNFWAWDFNRSMFYRVDAELLASNALCEIWVEKGSGVSATRAQTIANYYRDNIYAEMEKKLFWTENISGVMMNTMQFADWLGDENGKLVILLLDIKDGYSGQGSSYIAGYFDSYNFLNHGESNFRDMIYIDTNPLLQFGDQDLYRTIAHEMQHLMNFASTVWFRSTRVNGQIVSWREMDVWIDEGLSESAEWIYSGEYNKDRINWYNADNTLLSMGDNFFVWNNYEDIPNSVLNDYATVNLFFQWLRLESGANDIYKRILTSTHNNVNAVLNSLNGTSLAGDSWAQLLEKWYTANYIGNYTIPGYGAGLKRHYVPTGTTTVQLFPGEGVFSSSGTGLALPQAGVNIIYIALNNYGVKINPDVAHTLLTFNANPNNKNGWETGGTRSGVFFPSGMNVNASVSGGRSLQSGAFSPGSNRIGGGSLLRHRGLGTFIDKDFSGLFTGAETVE